MEKNSIELKAREIYEKMLYEIEDVEAERPGNDGNYIQLYTK